MPVNWKSRPDWIFTTVATGPYWSAITVAMRILAGAMLATHVRHTAILSGQPNGQPEVIGTVLAHALGVMWPIFCLSSSLAACNVAVFIGALSAVSLINYSPKNRFQPRKKVLLTPACNNGVNVDQKRLCWRGWDPRSYQLLAVRRAPPIYVTNSTLIHLLLPYRHITVYCLTCHRVDIFSR